MDVEHNFSHAPGKRARYETFDLPSSSSDVGIADSVVSPMAVYSALDKKTRGKRRSPSGYVNVTALNAIVGLAASGFFTPGKKRKRAEAPPQTALGFINVPTCKTLKRKRY